MTDDSRGLAGDRRRNPFPSLNDTEYELLMEKIESAAERGADKAVDRFVQSNCLRHEERTEHVETAVFGRSESGIVGLDERMRSVERSLGYAAKSLWIAIGAFIVAVVGVATSALFGK